MHIRFVASNPFLPSYLGHSLDNRALNNDGLLAREVRDIAHDLGPVLGSGLLEAIGAVPVQRGLDGVRLGGAAQVGDLEVLEAEGPPPLGDERHVFALVVVHVEGGAFFGRVEDGDGGHFCCCCRMNLSLLFLLVVFFPEYPLRLAVRQGTRWMKRGILTNQGFNTAYFYIVTTTAPLLLLRRPFILSYLGISMKRPHFGGISVQSYRIGIRVSHYSSHSTTLGRALLSKLKLLVASCNCRSRRFLRSTRMWCVDGWKIALPFPSIILCVSLASRFVIIESLNL